MICVIVFFLLNFWPAWIQVKIMCLQMKQFNHNVITQANMTDTTGVDHRRVFSWLVLSSLSLSVSATGCCYGYGGSHKRETKLSHFTSTYSVKTQFCFSQKLIYSYRVVLYDSNWEGLYSFYTKYIPFALFHSVKFIIT